MTEPGYSVVFFCPGQDLEVSGTSPEGRALEAGAAAIKMAEALSRKGNRVTVAARTRGGSCRGVEYRDSGGSAIPPCDVLIAVAGDGGDLSGLDVKGIDARLKTLWLLGPRPAGGFDDSSFGCCYAESVFLKRRAVEEWGLPFAKVRLGRLGYDPDDFAGTEVEGSRRNPCRIVTAGRPASVAERAVDIVRRLRRDLSDRFTIDVFDGRNPGTLSASAAGEGEEWCGRPVPVPQADLCRDLATCGVMLHLGDGDGAGTMLVHQAKRAGAIVITSGEGASAEAVADGYDGFLIDEKPGSERCYQRVRKLLAYLLEHDDYAGYVRANAQHHQMTWGKTAGEWLAHWDETLRGRRGKRIVVSGYYGFGNLGDEAILSCMAREISGIDPSLEIVVVSGDPFDTERRHHLRAVPRDDFKLQTRAVERSDLVVLGGGGLFQDHGGLDIASFFSDHTSGIVNYANLPLMAKMYGKPVIYYAHGVGPLFSRDAFLFTRWAFSLADRVSVRDSFSRELLVEVLGSDRSGIGLSYDPVLASPLPARERAKALLLAMDIPEDRRLVVVAPRFWLNRTVEERFVAEISASLNSLADGSGEFFVVLVPFHLGEGGESDLAVCEAIGRSLRVPCAIVRGHSCHEEILSLYRCADFSLSMRYHALILSAVAGTPMIAVSYDKKDEELMRDLDLGEFCMDFRKVKAREITEAIARLTSRRPSVLSTLEARVQEILAQRVNSVRMVQSLLEGRAANG